MDKLTRDLVTEYADKGIIVQSLLPGYVATNMSRIRISSYTAPSAIEYAKVALKTIGLQSRSAAYPPHRVMVTLWTNWNYQIFTSCIYPHLLIILLLRTVIWNQLGSILLPQLLVSSQLQDNPSNVAESQKESSETCEGSITLTSSSKSHQLHILISIKSESSYNAKESILCTHLLTFHLFHGKSRRFWRWGCGKLDFFKQNDTTIHIVFRYATYKHSLILTLYVYLLATIYWLWLELCKGIYKWIDWRMYYYHKIYFFEKENTYIVGETSIFIVGNICYLNEKRK